MSRASRGLLRTALIQQRQTKLSTLAEFTFISELMVRRKENEFLLCCVVQVLFMAQLILYREASPRSPCEEGPIQADSNVNAQCSKVIAGRGGGLRFENHFHANILKGRLPGQPAKVYLIHNVTKLYLQFQVFRGEDSKVAEGGGTRGSLWGAPASASTPSL